MMNILKKNQQRPGRDDLQAVADGIARLTAGHEPGGFRVDWKQLSDEEAHDLVALSRKADAPGGFQLPLLSKSERRTWERLIELGSGHPDFFAELRKSEKFERDIAAMA